MRAMVSTTSLRTAGSAGWASSTSTRALGEHAHVLAAGERAFVDRAAVGVLGKGVGEDQRRARARARRGTSRSRRRRRATGRRRAPVDSERASSRRGSRPHNRRASCLRARGRCRHSPDNRTRPRGVRARNARAAAARRICPSRLRGGRRSACAALAGFVIADRNAGGGFHPGHVAHLGSGGARRASLIAMTRMTLNGERIEYGSIRRRRCCGRCATRPT